MSFTPEKFKQYYKFIHFMLKYWNSDIFRKTSSDALEVGVSDEDDEHQFQQTPEELVEDLKAMGLPILNLGELLSTRSFT